ncbi:hypothetical protein PVAND_000640 [Polypedilum vanderplanki]|uniref:Uncharacterized protein n=1 Tax=Polypedilum vanderplanki TaxID=319348 RepID=A0A9J6BKF8_POLVA|nr:hypothetical protein PVAND_000640 [Polypedilum vanderplanki]
MNNFTISTYLMNFNKSKKTGTCKNCKKNVQWAKERVAAHKRTSCCNITEEEKKFFSKQKSEMSFQSTSTQSTSSSSLTEVRKISEKAQTEADRKLAKLFAQTKIPLRIVESAVFKELVKSLNPSYQLPCAKKLSEALNDN